MQRVVRAIVSNTFAQTTEEPFRGSGVCLPTHKIALEDVMGRGLLLWLIGIPLPIILVIWLLGGLN